MQVLNECWNFSHWKKISSCHKKRGCAAMVLCVQLSQRATSDNSLALKACGNASFPCVKEASSQNRAQRVRKHTIIKCWVNMTPVPLNHLHHAVRSPHFKANSKQSPWKSPSITNPMQLPTQFCVPGSLTWKLKRREG